MDDARRPYSPARLAERWECTPEHIMKLCRAGDLRAFKLGPKLWRIPVSEVERWESGAAIPTPPPPVIEERSAPISERDASNYSAHLATMIQPPRGLPHRNPTSPSRPRRDKS